MSRVKRFSVIIAISSLVVVIPFFTIHAQQRININTASVEELQTLHGIGPVYADRIVQYRQTNAGFSSISELQNVTGIGPVTLDAIRDQITVSSLTEEQPQVHESLNMDRSVESNDIKNRSAGDETKRPTIIVATMTQATVFGVSENHSDVLSWVMALIGVLGIATAGIIGNRFELVKQGVDDTYSSDTENIPAYRVTNVTTIKDGE